MRHLIDSLSGYPRRCLSIFRSTDRSRGSATSIISMVLGGGVLLGMGAMVVDIGQIYIERSELQSGADAAASALAQVCAKTPANCAHQATLAQQSVNNNAKDHRGKVVAICGTGQGLPSCPPENTNLTGCIGDPPATAHYVEVLVATETSDGSDRLPTAFGRALSGNGTYQGEKVGACARAAWGSPGTVNAMGVTISTCDWNQLVVGPPARMGTVNTAGQPVPPSVIAPTTPDGPIYLHSTSGASNCPAGPSGWDAPGGFGWLDPLAGPCAAVVDSGGHYGGDTGVSPGTCDGPLAQARATHAIQPMAIFDGVRGTGSNTEYHLDGVSAFVLTGYSLPGMRATSNLTGRHYCNGSEHCLYGYFVTAVIKASTLSNNTGRGAIATLLVG